MATLRFRMFGTENQVDTMIRLLHGMDEVDRIEEVADQINDMRDDSSSANLHDQKGAEFHDIEARTRGKSVDDMRDLIETTARDISAAVEFVERF